MTTAPVDRSLSVLIPAYNESENILATLENVTKALEPLSLPREILVHSAKTVSDDFHARFSAKSKIYRYDIWNTPTRPLFEAPYVLWHPHALNVRRMKQAAACLRGKHDFWAFCHNQEAEKNHVRTIQRISVVKEGPLIRIIVKADGFLKQMVRNLVGTLVEVGKGKLSVQDLKKILKAKDRRVAGPAAPAKGLFLERVYY